MTAERIVHVVDDDDATRDSLAFLLSAAGIEPRTYASADAFLEAVHGGVTGCVVTDVRMPGMSGIELMSALRDRGLSNPVIVVTGHGDVPLAVEAMKLGAIDFIEKPFDDAAMLAAIEAASTRHARAGEQDEWRAAVRGRLAKLSERERQVLDGLVAGKTNKTIAHNLGISPRTVEVYRANLMTKTDAASLSELVRMALAVGS
jgi:two-component system response regulator FixJ